MPDFSDYVDEAGITRLRATGGGSGASRLVSCVRLPITFDTPGLVPTTFAITAYDEPTQMITVAGNQTAAFAPGVSVAITNDGFANSRGAVVSAAFAGGETVVALTGGSLLFEVTPLTAVVAVGATIYAPTVGDILLGYDDSPITLVTVSQAWNGATPHLQVLTEAYRQAQTTPFVNLDATVADDPAGASIALSASPGFAVGTHWRLWRFTTADPLLVQVDDGNGLDPGATQGAADVILFLLVAS